jgi:hypothetical protein
MALTSGLQALATLKPLYDLGREISDANNVEKLRFLAGQALEQAINARAQTALLQDERNTAVIELATLKAKIEEADRFEGKRENYARERTHTGATVYREKGSTGPQAESPYYCPNCFEHKRISILNPAVDYPADQRHLCPECHLIVPLPRLYTPSPRQAT